MQLTPEQIDATKNLSAGANRIRAAFRDSPDWTSKMHYVLVELQYRIEAFLDNRGDPQFVLGALRLVHKWFGAPGDWGYQTNQGEALSAFYVTSWRNWTRVLMSIRPQDGAGDPDAGAVGSAR